MVDLIRAQRLAVALARHAGRDPDRPRSLYVQRRSRRRTALVGAIDRLAVVAIDVGGTSLKAGVLGPGGLHGLRRVPSRRELGPDAVLDNIASVAAGLIDECATHALDVAGIGIVVPGIIDAEGVGRLSVTMGWHDLPVRRRLADRLGRPVTVGHDVRSGAVAEVTFGAAAGARSALFVPIGTGIAAALVVDGVIHPGTTFRAGEIGQVHVGTATTLEAVASARAIAERYAAIADRAAGSVDAGDVAELVAATATARPRRCGAAPSTRWPVCSPVRSPSSTSRCSSSAADSVGLVRRCSRR